MNYIADVLVIGGSTEGGIGEAITNRFRSRFDVACPPPEDLDVTDFNQIMEYMDKWGGYSHVVYCAGVQYLGRLDALDPNEIKDIFDVNVIGFINLMAALTRQQDMGKVCAVSSLAGRVPMTGSIGYCSSKAALNHAVRCAARELNSDWQITAVVPATVADTPITTSVDEQVMSMRNWDRGELLKQEKIRQPFGRRIEKIEVADVVYDIMNGPMTLTGSVVDLTGGA